MFTMISRWILPAAAVFAFTACSTKSGGNEPWREANSKLEAKYNLKMRSRSVPETDVPLLSAAKAQPLSALPKAVIAPGVTASLAWGKGALLATLEMEKGAVYPPQQLNEEVITVVRRAQRPVRLEANRWS
jgi:hypothetical protein